jgi:hypothetical protein
METELDKDLELINRQTYFVSAVVSLIRMVKEKSQSIELTLTPAQQKAHLKFRETCDNILAEYTTDNTGVDQGRIIKKVFKTLKDNVENLKTKDVALFTKRNSDGKIMTIIPGLNLGLIVPYFSEEEVSRLWQYVYMMYVSSLRMIYMVNETRKKPELMETLDVFEKDLAKSGMLVCGKVFNPYVGLGADSIHDMDELMKSAEGIKKTDSVMNAGGLLGMLGIDKLMDGDKLSEQLKNISQSDIDEATKNITDLLGASGDSDVSEVCSTLVNNIVADLKENGLESFSTVADRVSEKIGNKFDVNKMKKTALKMGNMMNDSENKLKNLKDKDGNPIGEDIMKHLSIPLGLAQSMGLGKMEEKPLEKVDKLAEKTRKPPIKSKHNKHGRH